jgi:hypothetical protein
MARRATPLFYIRGGVRRRFEPGFGGLGFGAEEAKQFLDFELECREGEGQRRPAGIDDYRPQWTQLIQVEAHGFSEPPLNQVADVGAAKGTWSREANVSASSWQIEGSEMLRRVAFPGVINGPEFAGS